MLNLNIQQRIELAIARTRYAKDPEGKWITLESGTHVQVDKDGNITGGPAALNEKGITNLSHFGEKQSQSSTTVDNSRRPADTNPVASDVGANHQLGEGKKMETMAYVTGKTWDIKADLQKAGAKFDGKGWTLERNALDKLIARVKTGKSGDRIIGGIVVSVPPTASPPVANMAVGGLIRENAENVKRGSRPTPAYMEMLRKSSAYETSQYRRAAELLGERVRASVDGEWIPGVVADVSDDGKSLVVHHDDGSKSSISVSDTFPGNHQMLIEENA